MLTTTLLAIWLGALPQATQTPPDDRSVTKLEVAAHLVYGAELGMGMAGNSGTGTFDSFTWTDGGCGLGSSGRRPANGANLPAVGWHYSAKVLQRVGDLLTVQIEWQRLWDYGLRGADAKTGTLNATMHVGDRLELDRAALTSSNGCGATGVRLEAAILQTPLILDARGMPVRGGGRGARSTQTGSGTSVGGQGGAGGQGTIGAAVGAGAGGGGGRGGASGGAGTGGRGIATAGALGQPGGVPLFNAGVWLVHTLTSQTKDGVTVTPIPPMPNLGGIGVGSATALDAAKRQLRFLDDGTLYQLLRFPASGSGFVFPAVPITTSQGTVSVIVTGTLSARVVNGVPTTLVVTVGRQVTGAASSAVANGTSNVKEIPWPNPGDVISFELPPATGTAQELTAGHQFALRLRLMF